jgi:hypothetical protein
MSATGQPDESPVPSDVPGGDARASARAQSEGALPSPSSPPLQHLIDLSRKPLREGMERTAQATAWFAALDTALLAIGAVDAVSAFESRDATNVRQA